MPRIAVDSARLYVLTESEGLKGLNHSFGSIKHKRCLIEFGNPQWSGYWRFSSSHDGRYVFFSHSHEILTDQGEQIKHGTKWLATRDEPKDGKPKPVMLDGEGLPYGLLSRDGRTLLSNSSGMNPITRVYRVREEAGKDPVGFIKFELDGEVLAVSGSGNRVIVDKTGQFEIHELDKDANKLICQIDMHFGYTCALNEDGSKAAFANDSKLRIIDVDKLVDGPLDQSAIVTVNVPKSREPINRLVYSNGGDLHMLSSAGVSLFNPLTKEVILLEAPRKRQVIIGWAISPDTDYIAIVRKGYERGGEVSYVTTVKQKLGNAHWKELFGHEAGKKAAERP